MVEKKIPYPEEPGYVAKVAARRGRMARASFDSLPRPVRAVREEKKPSAKA